MNIPSHRGQSTRARLILLVLLVAVPAFLLQVVGAWIDLQQNISARKQDAGQIVVRAQGKFETLLDTSRSVFTELVRLTEMRTPDNCTLIFNDLRLAYERLAPDATNVGLSDANGNIYCAVNPVLGNKVIADQPHFLRATQTLDMAIGDYTLNPATGLPTLSIAYPGAFLRWQSADCYFHQLRIALAGKLAKGSCFTSRYCPDTHQPGWKYSPALSEWRDHSQLKEMQLKRNGMRRFKTGRLDWKPPTWMALPVSTPLRLCGWVRRPPHGCILVILWQRSTPRLSKPWLGN